MEQSRKLIELYGIKKKVPEEKKRKNNESKLLFLFFFFFEYHESFLFVFIIIQSSTLKQNLHSVSPISFFAHKFLISFIFFIVLKLNSKNKSVMPISLPQVKKNLLKNVNTKKSSVPKPSNRPKHTSKNTKL